jgi:hypothetical protein
MENYRPQQGWDKPTRLLETRIARRIDLPELPRINLMANLSVSAPPAKGRPRRCKRKQVRQRPGDESPKSKKATETVAFLSVRWVTGDIGAGEAIRTLDPNLGKVMLYP